jgi:hypothetical protein
MFFVFVLSLVMMAVVSGHPVPWHFYVPVVLAGSMALWAIVANPQTGATLTPQVLQIMNRSHQESLNVADIVSIKVTTWTDGPDTVQLTLTSGRKFQVPSLCADSKLATALRDLGVRET